MTDREKLCKEFTELTGGHWHEDQKPEYCDGKLGGRCKIMRDSNPTYENPADILKVMIESKYCDDFLYVVSCGAYIDPFYHCIGIEYIVEEDKLLKAAVEFLKEGKNER